MPSSSPTSLPGPGAKGQSTPRDLAVCLEHEQMARQRAEQLLADTLNRHALVVSGANDGIWEWDIAADTVFYSARWKAMLGYSVDQIGSATSEWFDRIHPDDVSRFHKDLDAHLCGKTGQFRCEYRIRHRDEHYRWVMTRGLAERDPAGHARRAAGSQTEISNRKLAEDQLRHDALHDPLTGLANRAMFVDQVGGCIERARRDPNYRFAVLLLSVDRFKVITDSLGFDAGDQLLVEIARRLTIASHSVDCIAAAESDFLARLGEQEFVLVLDSVSSGDEAIKIGQGLIEKLAVPFLIDGHQVTTAANIGIALGDSRIDRAETLLRDANTALFQARNDADGRCRVYSPEMHARAVRRLSLECDLRQAIECDKLCLYYQPIHSLTDFRPVEFEALVRWQDSQRGLVQPSEFIPLAEEAGLIVPLGSWVLSHACEQLRRWQRELPGMLPTSIAVNVSGHQLARPELVAEVNSVLQRTGLNPRSLTLEITETAIMESGAPAMDVLRALHALGLSLHLDDFGTGYSSLRYLSQMPIDVLKIDRSFVTEIHKRRAGRSIVRTIIALARTLEMQVIAEGVETLEQVEYLRSIKCNSAQGFYFATPMPAEQVKDYLMAKSRWPRALGA
jgi:diguanylate cyclase (GGDEF)-like protein/PAS domain S-box-containing protein